MNYPVKSQFLFNYIISENKDELDDFMKKAKQKRNPKCENESLFDFFKNENDDYVDDENTLYIILERTFIYSIIYFLLF